LKTGRAPGACCGSAIGTSGKQSQEIVMGRAYVQAPRGIRGSLRAAGCIGTLCWTSLASGATFIVDTHIDINDTTYENEPIVVDGCTLIVDGVHAFTSVAIINGGTVTHSPNGSEGLYWMDLAIAEGVLITPGSMIDVAGRGYGGSAGPGAGPDEWTGGGGGHAGHGGASSTTIGGLPYGRILEPALLGSGGGKGGSVIGGPGGGGVTLEIGGPLTVDGTICADGASGLPGGYGTASGGGAGGAISIEAASLHGNGSITARGGAAGSANAGSGSGGRISIQCPDNAFAGQITAVPGATGYELGAAGTIRMAVGTEAGDLEIAADGTAAAPTPIHDEGPFQVRVADGATLLPAEPLVLHALTVAPGGLVTHEANAVHLQITVQSDMVVEAGGSVDVSARGCPQETGDGAGGGASRGSGGGHGGIGGISDTNAGGAAYGSIVHPADFGSGGGHGGSVPGGAGGGAIRLDVFGTLTVDGLIAADGAEGVPGAYYTAGGGGAGGSIDLIASSIAGVGEILANGGASGAAGASEAGGGAGGRIALHGNSITFSGLLEAVGGASALQAGGAGTIYLAVEEEHPTLIVDNGFQANGAATPMTEHGAYTMQCDGMARVIPAPHLTIGELAIAGEAMITHDSEGPSPHLVVYRDVHIQPTGLIDVAGLGYGSDAGPGAGVYDPDCWRGAGGGYGGQGGYSDCGAPGLPYGSEAFPDDLGSGGATGYAIPGSPGGGAIAIMAGGEIRIDGAVYAGGAVAGAGAYFTAGGGGSGGSVWLAGHTITGSGLIDVRGGNGHSFDQFGKSGGGGGGRIALHANELQLDTLITDVSPGLAYVPGHPGTCHESLMGVEVQSISDDVTITAGGPVTLHVDAATSVGSLTYRWRRNGVDLNDDGHHAGTNTPTLSIAASVLEDAGMYDVILTDGCDSTVAGPVHVIVVACTGDLNQDGLRDLADLGILLASFQVDGGGDIDGDGDTDLSDLGALLAHFGEPCS
jgi:hypothetical protein